MTAHTTKGEPMDLMDVAQRIVAQAGANEHVEVMVSRGGSTTVKAYGGAVESLSSAESAGVGIRVIVDGRVGFAHAGSLDESVLAETLAAARDNVPFAEPDEANVLAAADGVAVVPQPSLWSEEAASFPAERKVEFALELERLVLAGDPRIRSVRTSAFSDGWGDSALASTAGIAATGRGTWCSVGVQPLATEGDETQIGYGHDVARNPIDLDLAKAAAEAIDRSTRLLGAVKPPSGRMAIVLEPQLVATIFGIIGGLCSGEALVKQRTPFAGRIGDAVAAPIVTLVDDPTNPEGFGAEEYDGEGLACRRNVLIGGGSLERFLHNTYTAFRSGTASTGSAVRGARSLPGVGAGALSLLPGSGSLDELIAAVPNGLLVNSFAGLHSGVNPISGDFSVGADGLMIRDGKVCEPVRELTVASTLQRMLMDVVAIGGELEYLSSGASMPAVVIDGITISGT